MALRTISRKLTRIASRMSSCIWELSSRAKDMRRSAVRRRQLARTVTQPGRAGMTWVGAARGCLACDGGDGWSVEGRGEAGEDPGAERGDDLLGGAVRGEHYALDAGPDEAHLVEQGQVFVDE